MPSGGAKRARRVLAWPSPEDRQEPPKLCCRRFCPSRGASSSQLSSQGSAPSCPRTHTCPASCSRE
eukprot:10086574-Alexandrium_andersonii.AAC.1